MKFYYGFTFGLCIMAAFVGLLFGSFGLVAFQLSLAALDWWCYTKYLEGEER
jgi:hypothetical protein